MAVVVAVSPLLILAGFLLVGALQTPNELEPPVEALPPSGPTVRMLGPDWETPRQAETAPQPQKTAPPSAWETRAASLGKSAGAAADTDPKPPAAPAEGAPYRPVRTSALTPRKLLMTWPIESQSITSKFGGRIDPVDHIGRQHHKGVDIGAMIGTPVVAAAPGRVVFAGPTASSGLVIKISHTPTLFTQYRHLASLRVRVGDRVQMGQRIGLSGATGRTTGPHLHFEIWENGQPQNPFDYAWADFNERETAMGMISASRSGASADPMVFPGSN